MERMKKFISATVIYFLGCCSHTVYSSFTNVFQSDFSHTAIVLFNLLRHQYLFLKLKQLIILVFAAKKITVFINT